MQDLRFAVRGLRKQPLFSLVAILTLALGIGANTAIFSLLYRVVLRPQPYRDPSQLVFVWNSTRNGGRLHVAIPDYLDRRSGVAAFEDATLFTTRDATLSASGHPEQVLSLAVTPSFFSTLGRGPALGRAFTDAEAVPGADRSVILTNALWRSHFGGDPAVVGRTIPIDGEPYTVVGVLPADFDLPVRDVALLRPFAFTPAQMSDQARGNEFSQMIARLRRGATMAQADAQMRAIVTRLIDRLPQRAAFLRNSGFTGIAVPLSDELVGDLRGPLLLLQGGVLLVLLIACANVANLLLMRASGRSRELALRARLGASRGRILRQLLVEGALLAGLGTAGGIALAAVAVRVLVAMVSDRIPSASGASLDPIVLLFTAAMALVTGVVFGAVPAVSVLRDGVASALKEDGARASASHRTGGLRASLITAEVALAVMLLIAAGLLTKSFARVLDVDPGFETGHILSARVALPSTRYADAASIGTFWSRLGEAARSIPGVKSVALTGTVPFSGDDGGGSYTVVGRAARPGEEMPHAFQHVVGGDYFGTMGIPLLAGRPFNGGDTAAAPRVVVIDEMLATRMFPGADPIGHQLNFGSPRNYTIVGVARTVNGGDPTERVPEGRIYFSVAQVAEPAMSILLKSDVEPASLAPALRSAVQGIDPEQAISDVRTLDAWRARVLQPRRTPTTLIALFGALALLLSAVGIYGVVAFGVAQRVREFGIRQALGADSASILLLVLRQGLRTTAAGVALGVAGAFALGRYLEALLFGVSVHDAGVFAAAAALLSTVALLACYVPARRAGRVEPLVALRGD